MAREVPLEDRRGFRHVGFHEDRLIGEIDLGDPPPPKLTSLLIGVCLAASIATFATHGFAPDADELARSGGAGIGAIATGACGKLVVANVLHVNILHLGLNVVILWVLGRWLEALAGRMLTGAVILWSMICCSIGAMIVNGLSGPRFVIWIPSPLNLPRCSSRISRNDSASR